MKEHNKKLTPVYSRFDIAVSNRVMIAKSLIYKIFCNLQNHVFSLPDLPAPRKELAALFSMEDNQKTRIFLKHHKIVCGV